MAIREIVWTLSQDGKSITPNVPQDAGWQGEHNATKAVFNIPEGCALTAEGAQLYIGCEDATGKTDKSPVLTVENGQVSFLLPRAWTKHGGTSVLTLTAESADSIAYAPKARAIFHSRQTATGEERRLIEGFMQAAVDRAEDAASNAEAGGVAAREAADRAEQAAADAAGNAEAAEQSAKDAAYDSEDARRAMSAAETAAVQAKAAEEAAHQHMQAAAFAAEEAVDSASEAAENAKEAGEAKAAAVRSAETSSTAAQGAAMARSAAEQHAANASASKSAAEKSAQDAALSASRAATAAAALVVDTELSETSTKPVQNKVVKAAISEVGRQVYSALEGLKQHATRLAAVEDEMEALKANGGGTTEIVIGKNKLNLDDVMYPNNGIGYQLSPTKGTVVEVADGTNALTGFTPVIVGETYVFQYFVSGAATGSVVPPIRLVAYDKDGGFFECKDYPATYKVPNDVATVRFVAQGNRLTADAKPMFFIGDGTPVDYEPYTETEVTTGGGTGGGSTTVKAEDVVGLEELVADKVEETAEEVVAEKIKFSFRNVDSVCDRYSNESETVTVNRSTNRPVDANGEKVEDGFWATYNVQDVYALYDGLVNDYPDYVTRTLMGEITPDMVQTPNTTAWQQSGKTLPALDETLPIYRYDFKPPALLHPTAIPYDWKASKILYVSGTHGGEMSPVLQGFRFFKDLCANWRNQELLKSLRFNCHFTVIPLANPYGMKFSRKTNERGVNLNRNFTNEWVGVSDNGTPSSQYSGEAPASEFATQRIEYMIANERFDFGLDHHTFDSFEGTAATTYGRHIGYFCSNDEARPQDKSFADLVGTWISAKTVCNNTMVTDLSKSYCRTTAGNAFNGYMYGAFPAGYCFETIFSWGNDEMEALYPCQKFGAEVLGGIFHTAMVSYHTF